MTQRLCFALAALTALPVAAFAQASATPSANPISTSEAKIYGMLSSGTVIAAAEKMPEEFYSFKPSPDVRSFGQLVGHVADAQYYFCASAAGDTPPHSDAEKTKTAKADLVAALKDAVAYCNKQYAAMTDAKGGQMAKLMNFDVARIAILSANTAHTYEHYGNMVTYMRLKGIVPPTSDKESSAGPKSGQK